MFLILNYYFCEDITNITNMIIGFSIKNFLSFKETQIFQMTAAPIREKFESFNQNKFNYNGKIQFLKSAVLYGANASGKTNFIKALSFFKNFILTSANLNPEMKIPQIPFFLNIKTRTEPSEFEIVFLCCGLIYRYGFIISRETVIEEWLYQKDKRETMVFRRNSKGINIPRKYTILNELRTKNMIRPNALLLSIAAQFNDKSSIEILQWFSNNLNIISGLTDELYSLFSINLLDDSKSKDIIISLIKTADPGIEDLKVIEKEGENILFTLRAPTNQIPEIKKGKAVIKELNSVKHVINDSGEFETIVEFPFELFESEGTKKFFHLLGPVMDTLRYGKILVIDELDTKLHPLITRQIVKLFNNNKTNPNNAQLIFATHDIQLLDAKIFRRDQIWFTEKQDDGSTRLYSLLDFKKGKTPRNDEKISKNYAYGKYGAVPYTGDIDILFEDYINYNK